MPIKKFVQWKAAFERQKITSYNKWTNFLKNNSNLIDKKKNKNNNLYNDYVKIATCYIEKNNRKAWIDCFMRSARRLKRKIESNKSKSNIKKDVNDEDYYMKEIESIKKNESIDRIENLKKEAPKSVPEIFKLISILFEKFTTEQLKKFLKSLEELKDDLTYVGSDGINVDYNYINVLLKIVDYYNDYYNNKNSIIILKIIYILIVNFNNDYIFICYCLFSPDEPIKKLITNEKTIESYSTFYEQIKIMPYDVKYTFKYLDGIKFLFTKNHSILYLGKYARRHNPDNPTNNNFKQIDIIDENVEENNIDDENSVEDNKNVFQNFKVKPEDDVAIENKGEKIDELDKFDDFVQDNTDAVNIYTSLYTENELFKNYVNKKLSLNETDANEIDIETLKNIMPYVVSLELDEKENNTEITIEFVNNHVNDMKKIWEERLKNKPTNLEQNIKIGKEKKNEKKNIEKKINSVDEVIYDFVLDNNIAVNIFTSLYTENELFKNYVNNLLSSNDTNVNEKDINKLMLEVIRLELDKVNNTFTNEFLYKHVKDLQKFWVSYSKFLNNENKNSWTDYLESDVERKRRNKLLENKDSEFYKDYETTKKLKIDYLKISDDVDKFFFKNKIVKLWEKRQELRTLFDKRKEFLNYINKILKEKKGDTLYNYTLYMKKDDKEEIDIDIDTHIEVLEEFIPKRIADREKEEQVIEEVIETEEEIEGRSTAVGFRF